MIQACYKICHKEKNKLRRIWKKRRKNASNDMVINLTFLWYPASD